MALALAAPRARGGGITLQEGDVTMEIPVPGGFGMVPESDPGFEVLRAQVGGGGNDLRLMLRPDDRMNNPEDFGRQYDVQTVRKVRGRDASKEDLEKLRRKTDSEELNSPETFRSGMFVHPVHDFSDRHYSFASRMIGENGQVQGVVTTTVLIRGRMWLLYVRNLETASPEEMIKLKELAAGWVGAIIAANPSDAETLEREEGIRFSNINWRSAALAGGGGAIVAALMAMFAKVHRNNKRRAAQPGYAAGHWQPSTGRRH
ncbi:MAG TPA: hypothetical protein VHM91_21275 [Verrucomicrobiales bacterium]|nr:hypothetical protein [Verrucomicrobiales bacterium]